MISQPGQLNRRIVVERCSSSPDQYGQDRDTWRTYRRLWARREDLGGSEGVKSQEIAAKATVRWTVKYSSITADIDARDRVLFRGRLYEIVGTPEIGTNEYLQIDTVARGEAVT